MPDGSSQPMPPVRAAVVIPALDAAATLGVTLEALSRQDADFTYELIVVDNCSSDGTVEIAAAMGARVVRMPARGRPGAARNRGVATTGAELIAFTDADCAPMAAWLRVGCQELDSADLVQGRVIPDPEARRAPFDRTLTVDREDGIYQTANLFVRREPFDRVGGFGDPVETAIRSPFGEDTDLAWRMRRAGASTEFAADAVVAHAVFRRGPLGFLRERLRYARFPALLRRIPELRRRFLRGRLFISSRSAAFDLALAGSVAAWLSGSAPALIAVGPYLYLALRDAARWRRWAPVVLIIGLLADLLGLLALVAGTLAARRPVL